MPISLPWNWKVGVPETPAAMAAWMSAASWRSVSGEARQARKAARSRPLWLASASTPGFVSWAAKAASS